MRHRLFLLLPLIMTLSACGSPPNVHGVSSYNVPLPPKVEHPYYDPTMAYGSANATWRPPVYNLRRTIVKPVEPTTLAQRPDYEQAEWATGAGGSSTSAPAGTF